MLVDDMARSSSSDSRKRPIIIDLDVAEFFGASIAVPAASAAAASGVRASSGCSFKSALIAETQVTRTSMSSDGAQRSRDCTQRAQDRHIDLAVGRHGRDPTLDQAG